MKTSVVVVDDHQLIARAISDMVNAMSNFEVLYEAENGKALIEKLAVKGNVPDIVLLDISMPIMNGYDTAEWLQKHHPEVRILVLSMQGDDESLLKMVKFGIKGYLHKNVPPAELEKALTHVMEQGMYFPAWATNIIFQTMSGNTTAVVEVRDKRLNDRELEFMGYVCTELTYKEIADKMCCSPRTVEGYRDALFEKLDTKTRVGLAMYAIKLGIVKVI